MTADHRARRRYLLAWFPRMALVATAVLAPVIDGGNEESAADAAPAVETLDAVVVTRVVLSGAGVEDADPR